MASGYLRIAFLPSSGFGYAVLAALNDSKSLNAKKILSEWEANGAAKHLVSLSTKLRIIDVVLERLDSSLGALKSEVAKQPALEDAMARNQGVIASDLVFDVLTDIDAFFFEFKSTSEILRHFIKAVGAQITGFPTSQKELLNVLKQNGVPDKWTTLLAERRILHFHNSGIWLAYDVRSTDPFSASEIVLESPTSEERVLSGGLSFGELQSIRAGLLRSIVELERLIVKHIKALPE